MSEVAGAEIKPSKPKFVLIVLKLPNPASKKTHLSIYKAQFVSGV
jgi:hypothetical protein